MYGSTASSAAPTASTGAVASAAASAAPAVSPAASYELESELLTYNWSEYVSEKNKAEFTARTGVAYSEDIFSNNEELVAKLAAAGGNPGYDVACPTGEYCPGMIEAGYLEKLDMSRLRTSSTSMPPSRTRHGTRTTNTSSRRTSARPGSCTGRSSNRSR